MPQGYLHLVLEEIFIQGDLVAPCETSRGVPGGVGCMKHPTNKQRITKFIERKEKGTTMNTSVVAKELNLHPRTVSNIFRVLDNVRINNPKAKDGMWVVI